MFILWFDDQAHTYYHATFYDAAWGSYPLCRPNEGWWLVPGTDPEDPAYS